MSAVVEHETMVDVDVNPRTLEDIGFWWQCLTDGCRGGRGGFRTEDAARTDAASHVRSMLGGG